MSIIQLEQTNTTVSTACSGCRILQMLCALLAKTETIDRDYNMGNRKNAALVNFSGGLLPGDIFWPKWFAVRWSLIIIINGVHSKPQGPPPFHPSSSSVPPSSATRLAASCRRFELWSRIPEILWEVGDICRIHQRREGSWGEQEWCGVLIGQKQSDKLQKETLRQRDRRVSLKFCLNYDMRFAIRILRYLYRSISVIACFCCVTHLCSQN